MKRLPLHLVLLLSACMPLVASAQEPVTIRKKSMALGGELSVDIKVKSKVQAKKVSPAGRNVLDTAFAGDDRLSFVVTPLEFNKEGRLTKHLRHFVKAEKLQYGGSNPLSFHGQRFLYVEKDGKDDILSERGEALALGDRLDLQEQSIPCDPTRADWTEILPKGPVKVGETFTINPCRWTQEYEVDLTKAKATGTLKSVLTRDGKQIGLIEYAVEVPLAGTSYQGSKLPILEGSILRYQGIAEMNIDGTECYHIARGTLHIDTKARGLDAQSNDTRLEVLLDIEIIERCN